jgi:very-short-patch-repair endonuclease
MYRVDPEMTRRARSLQSGATTAERTLWRLLSRYRPAFTRQLVVGPLIIDLACREAKLAVEIDGGQHAKMTQMRLGRAGLRSRVGP